MNGYQSGSLVPNGSLKLMEGAAVVDTETLNGSGIATFSISSLALGSDTLDVAYPGNSTFAASTSSNLTQYVQKANTSTAHQFLRLSIGL